ncbi:MAG: ABC transporter permease [Chloroflexi bacterium RBG_13_51_52]|nr:MAG: ABC transporter permease [Chloroflexi bacterium RBG_13_51_52]
MEERPPMSGWRRFARVFFGRKVVLFGLIVLALYVLIAIFADLIAPYDYKQINLQQVLAQPSGEHLLGTDTAGRDVLSRLIYGIRPTLIVGSATILIAAVCGTILGLIAGYFGGWIQTIIMRCIDALMGFPMLLLALVIAAVLGGGMKNIIIALGVASIPTFARVMCAQTLIIKENDYIIAGRSLGFTNWHLMWNHIVPNAFPPLVILATMNIGMVILMEAGLSFLGIGIQAPDAAWGSMVSAGYNRLTSNPMLSVAPGIAIMLIVFSLNMVGDGLRDAVDPRLRGTL